MNWKCFLAKPEIILCLSSTLKLHSSHSWWWRKKVLPGCGRKEVKWEVFLFCYSHVIRESRLAWHGISRKEGRESLSATVDANVTQCVCVFGPFRGSLGGCDVDFFFLYLWNSRSSGCRWPLWPLWPRLSGCDRCRHAGREAVAATEQYSDAATTWGALPSATYDFCFSHSTACVTLLHLANGKHLKIKEQVSSLQGMKNFMLVHAKIR